MKLLGSAMLCSGTLAGIAKAKALPFLALCLLLPSHLIFLSLSFVFLPPLIWWIDFHGGDFESD
jgi:hypothetical protein